MNLMSHNLARGHRYRTFNVLDKVNCKVLGIDIKSGIQVTQVTRYLDQAACWSYPERIRVDNGQEFISADCAQWANQHHIHIDYIEPGSPYRNGYSERFNHAYREDTLDLLLFNKLDEAGQKTDCWLQRYNHERPHESLNNMTPIQYLNPA